MACPIRSQRASAQKQDAWRVDSPQFAIEGSPPPFGVRGSVICYIYLLLCFALLASMLDAICSFACLFASLFD